MKHRLPFTLALLACNHAAPDHMAAATVSVAGLRQLTDTSTLGALPIAGASLHVSCADGTEDSATPTALSIDPMIFTPVAACGQAHLALSVQATAPSGTLTIYIGSADAVLSTGDVAVDFSGPLYGEVDFISQNGATFTCTGGPQKILVPASGAAVSLAVGDYTFVCSGSDGSSFSGSETVSVGERIAVGLPSGSSTVTSPSDATLVALFTAFGTLQPAFSPATTDYTLLLSSRRAAITFTPIAANPAAAITVNAGPSQAAVALASQATTDVVIVVTSADQTATQTYTVHTTRGLVNDIQFAPVNALQPALAPAQFSWDVPLYTFTDAGGASLPEEELVVTVATPNGVALTVGGAPVGSGIDSPVPVPLGASFVTIEAAAGSETDSYWVKAQNVAGLAPYGFVGVISTLGNEVAVQSVSSGVIQTIIAAGDISTTDPTTNLSAPVAITASPAGQTLYFAGLDTKASGGIIAWRPVDGPNAAFGAGDVGGNFTINGSFAPSFLAADPKARYLFTVSGTLVYALKLNAADGAVQFPVGQQTISTATSITALAVDPIGRFLFVASSGTPNAIIPIYVNPDGSLVVGTALPTTTAVTALQVSTQGDELVFVDGSSLIAASINPFSGALTVAATQAGVDASGGLAVFEGATQTPFMSLVAGGGTVFSYFGGSFGQGSLNSSITTAFGLSIDRLGLNAYLFDSLGGKLDSLGLPQSVTGAFSGGAPQATILSPSAIFYFDDWQGIPAG